MGSEAAILVPALSPEDLKSYALDNVSGFLISLVDGATSVESLLDMCGLPRLLALRHVRSLVERGIVGVGSAQTERSTAKHARLPEGGKERTADDDGTIESGVLAFLAPRMGTLTLDDIPVLLVAREELDGWDLDPRARSILALVDDSTTVETILARTSMEIAVGVALFERLAEQGILTFA
ncbi:MAG: hypothetical protein ACRENE_07035 [Polyangiaceae bacterium]